MASSSTALKLPCVACQNKSIGILRCEGCLQVFCRKHLIEHRDFLSCQLDTIVQEHDCLQQAIVENEDKQLHDLLILQQIDEWERASHEKIKQMANEARLEAKRLTSLKTISKQLRDLAGRLEDARRDEDYVESDLQSWTTILQNLRDDVNAVASSAFIEENPKETLVAKINVNVRSARFMQKEKFGEFYGPIVIENDGLVATHNGSKNGTSFVRGLGAYSSGKHIIRFLFKKTSLRYITGFDVVSTMMPINAASNSFYSAYGWLSNDDTYCDVSEVSIADNFRDLHGQTLFEIELMLDCDQRQISYLNQQTKNRRQLNVDIGKCPFPWQIQFHLFENGDCVKLLE